MVGPDGSVTLCFVNVDGFAAVNNGHGHDVRRQAAEDRRAPAPAGVADERALVARIGPDEFAVLIEDGAPTPALDDVIGAINAELAEAEYIE